MVLHLGRYFSVNNFIANTFFDDGSQGVDDQFIKSAHGAADVAGVAAQQDHRLLRRDRQVPRPRHAEQRRPGDGVAAVVLAGLPHDRVKWSSPFTSRLFLEAGWSSNLEYYTNSYQDGVEQPRGTAAWFAEASR